MADGALAGLTLVDELDPSLDDHHLKHATRAEPLGRAGRLHEAAGAYVRALRTAPEATRSDLRRRLDDIERR